MTTCLGKTCLFGYFCVSLMGVGQILWGSLFPFLYLEWDVIVLIPDHCLSICIPDVILLENYGWVLIYSHNFL